MHFEVVIKNAGEVVTLEGPKRTRRGEEMSDIALKKGVDIGIKGGIIAAVESDLDGDITIDAGGGVVMPGFVDPHTHLIYSGSRENELAMKLQGLSYLEILERGGGILSTVRKTRAASKERLIAEAERRIKTMLAFGTTTAEAKSGYGLDLETEIRSLEVISELNRLEKIELIPTYLGAHAVPPEFSSPSRYIDFIIDEVLPAVKKRGLARFVDIFCERNVFDIEDSRRFLTAAKEMGFGLKIHADEIENLGGVQVAAELGAISAEHLVKTTEREMEMMAESGTIAVLLPGTPYSLMERDYANARRMIEKGMAVAIATDLNPNCWTESMQFIASLSSYMMKMTPEEVITAGTINAAYAIGVGDEVGSIEVGKRADIIVLDAENYRCLPYHFGVNLVKKVVKGGRLVVENQRYSISPPSN